MANTKKIMVGEREYTIKANALLPRRYRNEFGKDLISELNKLLEEAKKGSGVDWSVAENLTWLMIKTAGVDEVGTIDEWLETIDDAFAMIKCFGDVLALWQENQETTSTPRKK